MISVFVLELETHGTERKVYHRKAPTRQAFLEAMGEVYDFYGDGLVDGTHRLLVLNWFL